MTQTDGGTMDDAKDLDWVMPMYNLIQCTSSYSKTTDSLWSYSKYVAINFDNNIENTDW